jgi:excisionase family DNA binding protein
VKSTANKQYLRVEEVALILGVDRHTVYRRIRDQQLPAIRLGRLWLVPREAVELQPSPPVAARKMTIREAARRSAQLLAEHEADLTAMFEAIQEARSRTDFSDDP